MITTNEIKNLFKIIKTYNFGNRWLCNNLITQLKGSAKRLISVQGSAVSKSLRNTDLDSHSNLKTISL